MGAMIDLVAKAEAGKLVYTKTGLAKLDAMLAGGFKPGNLVVLAGRPGMGKTTMGWHLARAVIAQGQAVLFFSMEMSAEEIMLRAASSELHAAGHGLPYTDLTRVSPENPLPPDDWTALLSVMERARPWPMVIDDQSTQTVQAVKSKARGYMRRLAESGTRLGLVVLDQLSSMQAAGTSKDNRYAYFSDLSGQVKQLARDLDVPVLCLHQLSREVDKRPNKRPALSDLRETGAIEQDADTVLFVYRPEYYLQQDKPERGAELDKWNMEMEDVRDTMEIIVGKQRMGITGKVSVRAMMRFNRITETEA